jgi:hypothetical protein
MRRGTVVAVLAVLCFAAAAIAQPPALISYQGKLVDSDGVPISGDHSLQFDLFEADQGGSTLWTQTHTSVPVTKGLFSVLLGAVPIDPKIHLDSYPELWLQVTLDASEVFSRVQLVSTPYALVAKRLSEVDATGSNGQITFTGNPTSDGFSGASVKIAPTSIAGGVGLFFVKDPTGNYFSVTAEEGTANHFGLNVYLGTIQTGSGSSPQVYNRFGTGTPESTAIDSPSDLLVSDSVEIENDLFVGNTMQIGKSTPVDGQAYSSITLEDYTPQSSLMGDEGDLAIENDLEVGSDLWVGDTLTVGGTRVIPPRAEGAGNITFTTTNSSYESVMSVTIDVPNAGYVYVQADGYASYDDGTLVGSVALSMDSSTFQTYTERKLDIVSSPIHEVFCTSHLFIPTAGSHDFHLLAKRDSGTGTLSIPKSSLTAIYIDLSGTGTAGAGAAAAVRPH